MKIGIFIYHGIDGRGGLENALLKTVAGLKQRGIQSTLFFWEPVQYPEFLEGFDRVVVAESVKEYSHRWTPKFIRRLINRRIQYKKMEAFFKEKIEPADLDTLVIIDLPDTLVFFKAILGSFHQKVPIISWIHGTLSYSTEKQVIRTKKILPLIDAYFAVSNGITQELYELYGINSAVTVNNPVDKATLIPRSKKNKFLFIGRIGDPRKQVDRLIKSLVDLKGEWSLSVIGSTGDLAKDQQFVKNIEAIGLEKNIQFYGWLDDPWAEIKSADLLLLNSYSEGFGLVLVEAMMRGIPAVSTDCPVGPNEIIEPDINGWLFDVCHENEMIKILQELIDGRRAYPSVEEVQKSVEQYETDNVLEHFKKHLERIINTKQI